MALPQMRGVVDELFRDKEYRRRLSTQVNFSVDAVWGVTNLVLGTLESSFWLITLGSYYAIFGIMRMIILARLRQPKGHMEYEDRRVERACGILMLASIFVLSGIVTLVMKEQGGFDYDEMLIYAMATFAFYSLAVSIVSYARSHKSGNVLVATNSRVNLVVALVSIFAVEVAMLAAFGTEEDAALRSVMPVLTGTGIALVMGFLGIRSIMGIGMRP